MKKQKNSEKFTNYERDLIKYHINPKICILSNGDDWEYLNKLIIKFNANITILGSDYNLLYEEKNQKDYDLIIYQSTKHPMSPQDNFECTYALGEPSVKYNKIMSAIRVSKYEDGDIRLDEMITLSDGVTHIRSHCTKNDLREIIDIGLNNLEEYMIEHENNKTLVKK